MPRSAHGVNLHEENKRCDRQARQVKVWAQPTGRDQHTGGSVVGRRGSEIVGVIGEPLGDLVVKFRRVSIELKVVCALSLGRGLRFCFVRYSGFRQRFRACRCSIFASVACTGVVFPVEVDIADESAGGSAVRFRGAARLCAP